MKSEAVSAIIEHPDKESVSALIADYNTQRLLSDAVLAPLSQLETVIFFYKTTLR
jgi:hypothetical protein